jgi:hypothetical protein
VCAQRLPQPFVTAFTEQVQVQLAERGQPAVRVVHQHGVAAVVHLEQVGARRLRQLGDEEPVAELLQDVPGLTGKQGDRLRTRSVGAGDGLPCAAGMYAKQRVGIVVGTGHQPVQLARIHGVH